MSDDYQKQQDLIFQEMQDRAAIEKAQEEDAEVRALLEMHAIDLKALISAAKGFRRIGADLDINQLLAYVIAKRAAADPSKT